MKWIAGLALLIGWALLTSGPSGIAAAAREGRGVNVLGYDPIWADPAKARFRPDDLGRIRAGGFDQVRVNLQAFAHMDAANQLDPEWLTTLDGVVRDATAAGLDWRAAPLAWRQREISSSGRSSVRGP